MPWSNLFSWKRLEPPALHGLGNNIFSWRLFVPCLEAVRSPVMGAKLVWSQCAALVLGFLFPLCINFSLCLDALSDVRQHIPTAPMWTCGYWMDKLDSVNSNYLFLNEPTTIRWGVSTDVRCYQICSVVICFTGLPSFRRCCLAAIELLLIA